MLQPTIPEVSDAARAANPSSWGVPEDYRRPMTASGLPQRGKFDVFDQERLNAARSAQDAQATPVETVPPRTRSLGERVVTTARHAQNAPYVGRVSMDSITGQRPGGSRPTNPVPPSRPTTVKRHRSPEPLGGLFRRGSLPRHAKKRP